MNQQSTSNVLGGTEGEKEAMSIINSDGDFVEITNEACEVHCRDREELLDLNISDIVASSPVKAGQVFQCMLNGNCENSSAEVICGDGSVIEIQSKAEPITFGGENCVKMTMVNTTEVESIETEPNSNVLEGLDSQKATEVVQNTRIDGPEGEMPLNKVMLDLVVAHNELEEYKKGALTLYTGLDQRLIEEQNRNPDSDTCAVLREIKESAFEVYSRVQDKDH